MRFWFVEKQGDKVFDHASLVLFIAVLLAFLTWLFPQQTIFYEEKSTKQIDSVSIAYLELLLQSAPHDAPLRLNLIDQLIHTGQFEKAISVLSVLVKKGKTSEHSAAVNMMRLRIMAQLSFTDTGSETAKIYRNSINTLLDQMLESPQRKKDRIKMAELALAIGEPGRAASQFKKLSIEDEDNNKKWLEQAIKWNLAAGNHAAVSDAYLFLSQENEYQEEKEIYFNKAIDSLLLQGKTREALLLYKKEFSRAKPSHSMLLGAAELSLAIGNREELEHYLLTILEQEGLTAAQLKRTQSIAISSANISLALKVAKRYQLLVPDDVQQLRTLARLYEWDSNLDKALFYWKQSARIEQRDSQEKQGKVKEKTAAEILRLALLTYNHLTIIDALGTLGRQRRLTEAELKNLVMAYEDIGRPAKGVQYLRDHINRYPDDQETLLATIYLLERDEKIVDAIYLWGVMDKRFGLTIENSQHVANLMWSQNDSESALQILRRKISSAKASNANYWRMLAALAWQEGDESLAYRSLKYVVDAKNLTESETHILLSGIEEGDPKQQLKIAEDSWVRFKRPHYLLKKMQLLLNLKEWNGLAEAMYEADKNPKLFSNNAHYWMLKAELQTHENDIGAAKHSYHNALSISGGDVQSVQNYLWFLISTGSRKELKSQLLHWQTMAIEYKSLWPIYAAAETAIADYSSALVWYKKILETEPTDLPTLLAYSDTLQLSGRTTAAWRLRRFLLRMVRSNELDRAKSPYQYSLVKNDSENTLRLVNTVYSYKDRLRSIDNLPPAMKKTNWLPAFTEQLIARGQFDTAVFLKNRSSENESASLDINQAAALAISRHDKNAMATVLDKGQGIVPTMETYLLEKMGYRKKSMTLAADTLSQENQMLNDHQQHSIRSLLATQADESPSGIQFQLTESEFYNWNIQNKELLIATHWEDWYLKSTLNHRVISFTNNLTDWSEEISISLDAQNSTRHGHWKAGVVLYDTEGDLDIGLNFGLSHQWDSSLNSQLAIAWNDETSLNSLLDTVAYYHHIDLSLEKLLSPRDVLGVYIQTNQFIDKYSERALSEGYRASLDYSHKLNFSSPLWVLSAGIDWMDNKHRANAQDILAQRLLDNKHGSNYINDTNDYYDISSMLPEKLGQMSIGTRFSNGTVHSLKRANGSFRYMASASLVYQWDKSVLGVFAQAGIAWRILGNDELALSYQLNTSPWRDIGKPQQDIKLSYNYRFSR